MCFGGGGGNSAPPPQTPPPPTDTPAPAGTDAKQRFQEIRANSGYSDQNGATVLDPTKGATLGSTKGTSLGVP